MTNNFDTGDIILFDGQFELNISYFFTSLLVKLLTGHCWTHIGIVVRDPVWADPKLKGLYLWESGYEHIPDSENGEEKIGVQIVPLKEVLQKYNGKIYYRQLKTHKTFSSKDLQEIHSMVHNRGYDLDPLDWIQAGLGIDVSPQKDTRFWCSALVACVYTRLGLFSETKDWSIVKPDYFAEQNVNEDLVDCSLGDLVEINPKNVD